MFSTFLEIERWLDYPKNNSLHKKKPRIYNFDKLLILTKAQT